MVVRPRRPSTARASQGRLSVLVQKGRIGLDRPAWRAGGLVALAVLLAAPAMARADEGPRLSLAPLLAEVKAHSPALRAAQERAAAMAATPAQARAWDDPTLSYEAWNTPESFRL